MMKTCQHAEEVRILIGEGVVIDVQSPMGVSIELVRLVPVVPIR
jgi:hypothetical protein